MGYFRSSLFCRFRKIWILIISGLFFANTSYATQYYGRVYSGFYASRERFADPSDGTTSNDFATASSRIYMKASDLGSSRWEMTGDVRDKHDFFDKLDREKLELGPGNTLQVRQLSIGNPGTFSNLFGNVGRFPIPDAGAVHTDGAELGYRWNSVFQTSIFGGLNPKRTDQTALGFNRNAQVFGAYSIYQPKASTWRNSFRLSNAFTAQTVSGHTDRLFWYGNVLYVWDSYNSISGFVYFDFVPRANVQNANLDYHHQITRSVSTTLDVLVADVIEYSRRRGVLERLNPSSYRELSGGVRHEINPNWSMDYRATYGMRSSDSLTLMEGRLGPYLPRFINRFTTFRGQIGMRKNFTSTDQFLKMNFGYFTKYWEFNLDSELGIRNYSGGPIEHPLIHELEMAHYLSQALYGTLSIQNAHTERVDIWSGFIKIGYRFGSQDVPPLRDGAPPRGNL